MLRGFRSCGSDKGMGSGTGAAYRCVRNVVPFLTEDRPLYGDINECEQLIIDGSLVSEVEKSAGEIQV